MKKTDRASENRQDYEDDPSSKPRMYIRGYEGICRQARFLIHRSLEHIANGGHKGVISRFGSRFGLSAGANFGQIGK